MFCFVLAHPVVGFLFGTKKTFFSYIDMIVLTTVLTPQTFNFIPRSSTFDLVQITDELTNTTVIISTYTFTEGDYFSTLESEFNLVENRFYILTIKDGFNTIYKDKIFCTNQSLITFSVNNGQYVSNSTTNEFIVYE